jgi:teichuronic acid biosynthesis glycosyltransferase TuaC
MNDPTARPKLLTFTTLFPNSAQPSHGIFVEARLSHLVASGAVSARVVAPVPYAADLPGVPSGYRKLWRVPYHEERRGIAVLHPRFPVVPKVGMAIAPFLLYLGVRRSLFSLLNEGYSFDVIDAHYFYPDGVAAAMLARTFNKPLVVTARGTDINLIPRYAIPRRMIQWAAGRADAIVTVCEALRDALVALGVPAGKIRVLRNGVDLALFHPLDRDAARAAFGLSGTVLLSVGHLIERKGHDLVIKALPALPGMQLIIVGEGPLGPELRRLTAALKLTDRVRFIGNLAQGELAKLYSAADLLILASNREGWANVLLEAMACGTPVVASNVWGTPEVVASPEAGELLEERSPEGIARAVRKLLARMPARTAVRAYAEQFSWDATTQGQLALFDEVLSSRAGFIARAACAA